MLRCREVATAASDYLDANMSWRRRLQMRLHLAMCAHCRRYVEQLAQSITALRRLRDEPTARDTTESVLAKVRQARRDRSE